MVVKNKVVIKVTGNKSYGTIKYKKDILLSICECESKSNNILDIYLTNNEAIDLINLLEKTLKNNNK